MIKKLLKKTTGLVILSLIMASLSFFKFSPVFAEEETITPGPAVLADLSSFDDNDSYKSNVAYQEFRAFAHSLGISGVNFGDTIVVGYKDIKLNYNENDGSLKIAGETVAEGFLDSNYTNYNGATAPRADVFPYNFDDNTASSHMVAFTTHWQAPVGAEKFSVNTDDSDSAKVLGQSNANDGSKWWTWTSDDNNYYRISFYFAYQDSTDEYWYLNPNSKDREFKVYFYDNSDEVIAIHQLVLDFSEILIQPQTLKYTVNNSDYGSIEGDDSQVISYHTNGTEVEAVPSNGYYFEKWEDNSSTDPLRVDTDVSSDITAQAIFTAQTELTIDGSFTVKDKPSDGNVSATIDSNNLILVGVINDDVVELTNVVVEFTDKNTGSNKEVKIKSAEIDGADAYKYQLLLDNAPTAIGRIYSTGGGGGGVATIIASQCTNVVYGEWGVCNGQFQFRSIVSQSPAGCTLTAEQQIATQRACSLSSDDLVDKDDPVVDESGSEIPPIVEGDLDVNKIMAEEKGLVSQVNNALVARLAGRILLQVEGDGQAWYLDPVGKAKHFMGRPADAFTMMRQFGLGVSEANFKTFEDRGAPDRLAGRILLRVESSGEAYYIDPVDMKMHYLGRPDDAFRIMRELALGITNVNLRQIAVGEVR